MPTQTKLRGISTTTKWQGIGWGKHFGDEMLSVDGDDAGVSAPRANDTGNDGNYRCAGRKGICAAKGRRVGGAGKATAMPANRVRPNPSSVPFFVEEVLRIFLPLPTTTAAGQSSGVFPR